MLLLLSLFATKNPARSSATEALPLNESVIVATTDAFLFKFTG
jgi:hypothetical protein